MIEPHKFFRKFKCVVQWINPATVSIVSARKTIDLGNVEEYEEFTGSDFNDSVKRTVLHLGIGKENQIIKMSFEEFEKIHDKFLDDMRIFDDRSLLKKRYNGPVRIYFDEDRRTQQFYSTCFPQHINMNIHIPFEYLQDNVLDKMTQSFN